MKRLVLLAVPVVATGALLLGRRDAPAPAALVPSPVVAPRDPMVGTLRAEVEALRADLEARPVVPVQRAAPAPSEPDVELSPDEQMAGHIARYASALAADPIDAAWSADAERAVSGAFAAAGPTDAVIDDVTCRATLCRVGLRFPSAYAREMGAPLLPSRIPWDTAGIMEEDEGDPTRVVLYAARSAELAPEL
jgi:hypothetical protein